MCRFIIVNLRYENRNGRMYAYTSTSKRMPGRKNPVSVKEYIGVVDPVSGTVIEKRPRSASKEVMLDGITVKNHGDVVLALTMAERIGVVDDLHLVFGDRYKQILAVTIAQTIRPSKSDRLDVVMEVSSLCEVLGIKRMTSDDICDIVNGITRNEIISFFRQRSYRSLGVKYVYAHAIPIAPERIAPSPDIGPSDTFDHVTMVIMMSRSGEFIGFRAVGRIQDNIGTLENILENIDDEDEYVFIPDATLSPYIDLPKLVRMGIRFALPFTPASTQFGSVSIDYKGLEGKEFEMMGRGGRYHLMTGRTGIVWSSDGYSLVPSSDARFNNCECTLRSFMCYDPREHQRLSKSMKIAIDAFRTQLDGKIFEDPEKEFSRIVGPWSHILRHSEDECGRMTVHVKRNEMSEVREQFGKTFVLSSSVVWDDVLAAHDAREGSDRVISQYHRGAQSLLNYHGSEINSESFAFIEFVTLMIRKRMQTVLDDESIQDMDVEKAFLIASSDRMIIAGDRTYRSSHSRKLAKVYRVFQIDPERHCPLD